MYQLIELHIIQVDWEWIAYSHLLKKYGHRVHVSHPHGFLLIENFCAENYMFFWSSLHGSCLGGVLVKPNFHPNSKANMVVESYWQQGWLEVVHVSYLVEWWGLGFKIHL